jgi:hypothetical protein
LIGNPQRIGPLGRTMSGFNVTIDVKEIEWMMWIGLM